MKDARIILGIDPGLAYTGFGVIEYYNNKFTHIAHGVIQTASEEEQPQRLLKIFDDLNNMILKYSPSEAGVETLYFAKNATSALKVSEARGIALLLLAKYKIRTTEYAPNTIKKTLTGIAKAEKEQVQQCVKLLLGLKEAPKPDHAADALAAAITRINIGDIKERELYYV